MTGTKDPFRGQEEANTEKVKREQQSKKVPPFGAVLIIFRRKDKIGTLSFSTERAGFWLRVFILAGI